ncbi:sulfatase [Egicoccus sp. AB-alg6-2]|uniref:sulfatase family protein n=1 Tax=Egicoccus sp. AB-alg6-2 TaxID=3242692 RepID=UPI00359ED845
MTGRRPNILLVIADDHAAHAISAYGSRINTTPGMDRIAAEGMRLDACFCTNSLCSPSRAAILTGTYNHVNGVTSNSSLFDARQQTFVSLLQGAGYQTAMIGKWHLGHGGIHDPVGFDHWTVLPDQGTYHDPEFLESDGTRTRRPGYVTDLITDLTIDWLDRRDRDRPFCAIVGHKAPHEAWEPAPRHLALFRDDEIAEPETLRDDYEGRATPAREATMRIVDHMPEEDFKEPVPGGLDDDERLRWKYQRYIKDYLRTVASLDENVGRLLDHLDADGSAEDTVVVYTSDQGFFLGDHGWYDKRFMYEESLKMPTLVRYPREIAPGSTSDDLALNVDFAPTFLDYARVEVPPTMQGRSIRPLLAGRTPADWRRSMYYRYWVHQDVMHNVWSHYGVRTARHKLIYFYAEPCGTSGASERRRPPEWELFDLHTDPQELRSVFDDPAYAEIRAELTAELRRLQREIGDVDCAPLPDPQQL